MGEEMWINQMVTGVRLYSGWTRFDQRIVMVQR